MAKSLHTDNAPSISTVKPHFLFAALGLLALSILMLFGNQYFLQDYYNNHMLAVTHTAVLGWLMMLIFGSLYQLIPVIFDGALYSEKLAKFTFWITAFSIIFLVYTFWIGDYVVLLPYAATSMYLSLFFFVFNIMMSYKQARIKNIKSYFILAAVFWLLLAETEGLLIALNFKYNFYTASHLQHLHTHAIMGLVGFFLMMIFGAGITLIPMFLISHRLNESYLYKTFYLLNAGIAGLVLTKYLYPNAILEGIFWLVIIIGIVYYFFYVNDSYQKRMKKTLDVGMRYTMLALVFLAAPIILSLLLILLQDSSQTEWLQRVAMLYGLSMVFGFFTTIALGQTYKTLPFIIWLEKYQKLVGKFHTPLPRELYNEKIADIQFYVYMAFLTTTIFAIFLQIELLIQIATVLFLIVTVLYNYNVWKMFFHDSEKYINQRENEILNKQN
jgi:hypothetical protein